MIIADISFACLNSFLQAILINIGAVVDQIKFESDFSVFLVDA